MLGAAIAGGGAADFRHQHLDSLRRQQRARNGGINHSGEFAHRLSAVRPDAGAPHDHASVSDTAASVGGINATAVNQIVASPASNLAFLTYTGATPGAKLPYYMPGSGGAPGTLNYVTLSGGNAVTAPVVGAFSLDDKLFFVSTAGDNLIHFVNTSTFQDTQQINPNLPACTPGSDPDCLITTPTTNSVPTTAIAVKPRSTT